MPPSGEQVQQAPTPVPAAPAAAGPEAVGPGPGPGAHPVLRLQGLIGNRAAARVVQRFVMPILPTESLELPTPLGLQSEDERIATIRENLDTWWIGPLNETVLQDVWASFGDELPAVAARYPKEFEKSVAGGANIADLPSFLVLRQKFHDDVVATAMGYLAANRRLVQEDRERLGLDSAGEEATAIGAIAQSAATEHLQEVAGRAAALIEAETVLKRTVVGYYYTQMEGGKEPWDEHFDPRAKPTLTDDPTVWERTKEQWDQLQVGRAIIGRDSPGVFALMEHGGADSPADVAKATPEQARAAVGRALSRVQEKIGQTETALAGGTDLDWRELGVIHHQLFKGERPGASGTKWSDTVNKSVAGDVVSDYEDHQWWVNLGLATAGAAAFLFSELATGGLATVLWASAGVGLAATQAGMAWESYDDLRTAAEASASPDTRLASHEQADAARLAAILETVFAFIDVAGGLGTIAKGGRRLVGEVGAALKGRASLLERGAQLEGLDALTEAEARTAVEAAVREFGAADAIRRTGKSADELAELVGRESDTGKRILGQATVSDAGVLGWWQRVTESVSRRQGSENALRALDEMPKDEAQRAVTEALDVLGPSRTLHLSGGWERLAALLDEGSPGAERLMRWREAIAEDLVKAFGPDRVRATGSVGKLSNDLDVSTLGADAARDRERVRMWLGARAGGSSDDLRRLLFCDVYTDPLRMHPADIAALGLSGDLRDQINRAQVVRQEQLMYNHRLYEAKAARNDRAAAAIREEMAAARVTEIPDFRPLTSGERERVGRQIDTLHAQLLESAKAGDGRVPQLIDQIADRQALINASEGGGYFTGGGTRRYVTQKEGIPGMAAGEMSPAQLFGAYLAQMPFLDKAAAELRAILANTMDPKRFEKALRALGKYGERQNEVAGALVRRKLPYGSDALDPVVAGWFDEVAGKCADLLREVREGGVRSALGRADEVALLRRRSEELLDEMERMSRAMRETLLEHSGAGGVIDAFTAANSAIRGELVVERAAAYLRFAVRELQEVAEQELQDEVRGFEAPATPPEHTEESKGGPAPAESAPPKP